MHGTHLNAVPGIEVTDKEGELPPSMLPGTCLRIQSKPWTFMVMWGKTQIWTLEADMLWADSLFCSWFGSWPRNLTVSRLTYLFYSVE